MDFSGISTALVTPFAKGQLDKASFLKLLNFQTQEGIRQFVLVSTTGESPTLEEKEIAQLCQWFKKFEEENHMALKLILPSGSYSTKISIENTKKAQDLGASALLVVTPYYNRPSQKGLILHYEKIAQQSSLPIILYNVPSRTACSLSVGSIKHLSQIENIIGIKEATGDMEFLKEIQKNTPKNFLLLSGDDLTCAHFFNLGGMGAISAAANILAKELIELFKSPPAHRPPLFEKLKPLLQELFKESNPVGPKQALWEMGILSSSELRLPMLSIKNPLLSPLLKQLNKLNLK